MRLGKALVLSSCLILAACAGQKPAATGSSPRRLCGDRQSRLYHECRPAGQRSGFPGDTWRAAPPAAAKSSKKGWRRSFHPRATSSPHPSSQRVPRRRRPTFPRQHITPAFQQPPAGGIVPAPAVPLALKHRMVIIEIGQNGLIQPLQEQLRRAGVAIMADPAQAAFLAQSATLTGPDGKSGFAVRLQQEYNVNEVIFVSAADGLAPGKTVAAEVYDTMGGGLLRGFDAAIPSYKETGPGSTGRCRCRGPCRHYGRVKELDSSPPLVFEDIGGERQQGLYLGRQGSRAQDRPDTQGVSRRQIPEGARFRPGEQDRDAGSGRFCRSQRRVLRDQGWPGDRGCRRGIRRIGSDALQVFHGEGFLQHYPFRTLSHERR